MACVEDGRTLRDAVQVVNEVPIHVWHLFLHEVKHEVAHIAERLRPGSGVAIVARLESEHIAPLPLGFVLAMLGLVVVGEVVADEPLLVRALADLLFADWTDSNEPAAYGLGRDMWRRVRLTSSDRFGWPALAGPCDRLA